MHCKAAPSGAAEWMDPSFTNCAGAAALTA